MKIKLGEGGRARTLPLATNPTPDAHCAASPDTAVERQNLWNH
jgi:hypothetical protein